MFYLYHHHDLARLADLLTVLRRSAAAAPLAADLVLVPHTGLGRWLKMHLAERDGIAANVVTALPAPFFWEIVAKSLPGERPDSSAYRRENLRWHLYAALPGIAGEVPELARYLAGPNAELGRWQVAERLAGVFDQYLIYRREMLLDWERGGGDAAPPARWQAPLWRALVARLGPNHRARLLGEFVRVSASGNGLDRAHWPARLYCFGLGNLPPDYLRLLYAIAKHRDVHFLMHNPSEGYWGDIERQPRALDVATDGEPLPGEEAAYAGHPLLASLGYAGRDFLRLVYSDEFAGIRELELGHALAYEIPGDDNLLHRLQSGVVQMEAMPHASGFAKRDRSFQVHACHGVLREVQVLHDQLLDLLTSDPTLQPRDIVVMTPDVAGFAPAIQAVFGAAEGRAAIPFNVSDLSRRGSHPIVLTFRTLLDLPLWRWTASEIIALVTVPAVMRRFALETADVDNLRRWIEAAGIRWGLDAEHRESAGAGRWAQNSWTFGLDRLLAGVAQADAGELAADVAPYVDIEGSAAQALGQLWLLTQTLQAWRARLPAAATPAAWQERLNALFADVFQPNPVDRDEQAARQMVTDAIAVLGAASECIGETALSWEAVREIVDRELDAPGARQPFLAGGVSFCGLVPLRTVPFRVICLLGMNEGAFPRPDRDRAISLIRHRPRMGDASSRDDDRLLLLQCLLSARDVFYVSYTGQDTSTGEPLEPSTAIAELLDFVAANQFAGTAREDALARLVTREPMQPFSPRYYEQGEDCLDTRVFTFRGGWRAGVDSLFGTRGTLPSLVDDSEARAPEIAEVTLDELKRFFEHPARYYLQGVLQLDLEIRATATSDEESHTLDRLQESRLRSELFELAKRTGSLPAAPSTTLRAQGVLPPEPLDLPPYEKLTSQLHELLPIWHRSQPAVEPEVAGIDVALPCNVRVVGRLGDVHPGGITRIHAWRLNAHRLLDDWIDLLGLAASGRTATLTVGGFDKDGRPVLRSGSLTAERAIQHLDRLVSLYLEGQSRPLCFLPELAMRYVEHLGGDKPKEPEQALQELTGYLSNSFRPAWETMDPWFSTLLLAGDYPLGESVEASELCALASAIVAPMDEVLQPSDPDEWPGPPPETK
jgi:exodeoxyribonuclease V gamma subunit